MQTGAQEEQASGEDSENEAEWGTFGAEEAMPVIVVLVSVIPVIVPGGHRAGKQGRGAVPNGIGPT